MCGVLHRNLGKGARCALPLHPSGLGSSWVLNPSRAIRTYRRSITRGRLRSPCTHRSKGLSHPLETHSHRLAGAPPITGASRLPRYPHGNFIETISWRPTLRGLDADQVCRDPIPTTKSLPVLFGNMAQPSAGWMHASVSPLDNDQGTSLDAVVDKLEFRGFR